MSTIRTRGGSARWYLVIHFLSVFLCVCCVCVCGTDFFFLCLGLNYSCTKRKLMPMRTGSLKRSWSPPTDPVEILSHSLDSCSAQAAAAAAAAETDSCPAGSARQTAERSSQPHSAWPAAAEAAEAARTFAVGPAAAAETDPCPLRPYSHPGHHQTAAESSCHPQACLRKATRSGSCRAHRPVDAAGAAETDWAAGRTSAVVAAAGAAAFPLGVPVQSAGLAAAGERHTAAADRTPIVAGLAPVPPHSRPLPLGKVSEPLGIAPAGQPQWRRLDPESDRTGQRPGPLMDPWVAAAQRSLSLARGSGHPW